MRRLFGALALVVLVLGAVAIYAVRIEPDWYLRARYPLQFQTIIEAHAVNYGLEPSLVAAVVYPQALELALAAYNAGQGNVDRWVAATPDGRVVRIRFRETRDYVKRVERMQSLYQRGYGLR